MNINKIINKEKYNLFVKFFAYSSFFYLLFNNISQLLFQIVIIIFVMYLIEKSKKEIEKYNKLNLEKGEKIDFGDISEK
jgi:predicted membrane protein